MLQQLQHILKTSLYTSVVRVNGFPMHFNDFLEFNGPSIRVTMERFLHKSLQERHLACCGSDVLTEEVMTNFLSFLETGAGRVLLS